MLYIINKLAANPGIVFLCTFAIGLGVMIFFGLFHTTKDKQKADSETLPDPKPEAHTSANAFQPTRPVTQNLAHTRVESSRQSHGPSLAGGIGFASGVLPGVILDEIQDDQQDSNSIIIDTAPVESCQDTDQANSMSDNICTSSQESPCNESRSYDPPETTSYSDSGTCSDTSFGSNDE